MMDFDDREDEELCESDFRCIVADAESSIYNIKKQLLIVQTLRSELMRKEAIISALNGKICDLEKDSLKSSQYFHENRILVERSYQLERAAESCKNECFVLTKQVVTQSQRADSLEEELDSLVKNNAEKRTQSDHLQGEFAVVRTQLGATEETLRDIKSKNEALRYDVRRIELDGLKIRNDAKITSNQAEEKSQRMKDKCLTLERNVVMSDSLVKEQRDLVDRWTLKHGGLATQLNEKQSEIDHWKRIYNEQESVVNVLKDLTNNQKKTIEDLSENQILNSENLKKEVSIFSKKSFELQAQIKDMDSAIFFLSTNIEKFADNLTSQNSKLNTFSDNENQQNSELSIQKDAFRELKVENGKKKNSSEAILNSSHSHKMEKKYSVVKNQVKEAKIVMSHQQIRYEELLNTITILKLEKERKELQIENERKSYRQIVSDQNILLGIKEDRIKGNYIDGASNKSNIDSKDLYTATEYTNKNEKNIEKNHENDYNNENKDVGTNSNNDKSIDKSIDKSMDQIASDEEDIRILHETLEFVETLAVHATELENRFEEVLSEKRLLKKMCSGYDDLKAELSILASSCSLPESVPNIRENGINLDSYSSDTEIDSSLNFKSPYQTEKDNIEASLYRNKLKDDSLSFSRDSLKIRKSPFSVNFLAYRGTEKNPKKSFARKPLTIRIVGIYVLASLRLIRILGNVRSERNLLLGNPLLSSVKKNKRKMPLSVYQKSLGQDSTNICNPGSGGKSDSAHGSRSLLQLLASGDRGPAVESSFTPREGRSLIVGHHVGRPMSSSGGKKGGREQGGGGGIFTENILVLRETLCNMSELIASLRAKELLLQLSESRYGDQQKDLWTALREAEEVLRDNDVHRSVSTPPSMTAIGMRGRNSWDSGGRNSGDSGGRNSGDSEGSRHNYSGPDFQSNKAVVDMGRVNGRDNEREREIEIEIEMELEQRIGNIREGEDERERRRMRERERERERDRDSDRVRESINGADFDKPYYSTEYSMSSTISDDEDTILCREQELLHTPSFAGPSPTSAEHRPRSSFYHSHTVPTPTRTPTKSCLSSSFSSPVRYSLSSSLISDDHVSPKLIHKSPGGYTEKIIAGDEKHVSVALRAYALSVVEEEKISASAGNFFSNEIDTEGQNFSYSPHSVLHDRDGRYRDQEREREGERETQYRSAATGRKVSGRSPSKIYYTEDEIVELSQTS